MRPEELFLLDMLESADAAAQFVAGLEYETFAKNRLVRSAVIWELAIIGEAARNIPDELRQRYPDIPWPRIVAFRNVVIHRYFGTDWLEVWNTAVRNVPILREQIAAVLVAEFPGHGDDASLLDDV